MTVEQLREQLKEFPGHAQVNIWYEDQDGCTWCLSVKKIIAGFEEYKKPDNNFDYISLIPELSDSLKIENITQLVAVNRIQ